MAVPTLGGVTLFGTSEIRPEKNANIIPIPMPTSDADATEIFDMLGVVKMISLTGTYSAGSIASTKAWVDSLEALVDGEQDAISFISDQTGTVNCMIMTITTGWDVPGFTVNYSIKLVQGINS